MGGSRWGDSGEARGQIIVLAALLIAVMFVGLAVVLNTAIYTENLASRDTGSTAGPVAEHTAAEQRMERVLAEANFGVEDATEEERNRLARSNASVWAERISSQAAREGTMTTSRIGATTNGTRVTQSASRDFMPAEPGLLDEVSGERLDPMGITGRTNWLVVPNASTRAFRMTVQRDSLAPTRQGLLEDMGDLGDEILTGSDEFWVQFESPEGTWRVYLANDDADDQKTVAVVVTEIEDGTEIEGDTETVVGECTGPPNSDEVTVRVSAAELAADGEVVPCPALAEIEGERHDVGYVGADEVEGTYRLIADRNETEYRKGLLDVYEPLVDNLLGGLLDTLYPIMTNLLEDFTVGDLLGDDSEEDPYTTTAIYSISVEQVYVDDRVTYERNVTIAPVSPVTE